MTYFEKIEIENFAEIKIAGVCSIDAGTSFGGFGAIISENGIERNIFGGHALTTKNQMELLACIRALDSLSQKSKVIVRTNSIYLIDGITRYINLWKKNGWITKSGEHVKNKTFWIELEKVASKHQITWKLIFDQGKLAFELADQAKEWEKIKYKQSLTKK
jgi:ribonuclease HI